MQCLPPLDAEEAYLEARGTGLGPPIDRTVFDVAAQGGIRARFRPGLDEAPGRWSFTLWAPTAEHVAAAALRPRGPGPVTLLVAEAVPWQEESPLVPPVPVAASSAAAAPP